ncbi:MAG: class I SAM-dependent methyltransferase [Oscillospiraceae bacterium]|nr:class I SAM-dependent methyltransferase [Oscillospiraceae bacterium]
MEAYGQLAVSYDFLTGDVPYGEFAQYYEKLLIQEGKENLTLLDLCCGTGTLTFLMAEKGHEMIGVDISEEMLAVAAGKNDDFKGRVKPIFLCQEAAELDLFGTVEGAYCSLDGMNYLPPEDLPELFHRLHLFIEPGGKLAFDFHSPERLRSLDGGTFVDEDEDMLCLWRAEFDEEEQALVYGMDIFRRKGKLWEREMEEHVEFVHEPEALLALLRECGFADAKLLTDGPQNEIGRLYIVAVNG